LLAIKKFVFLIDLADCQRRGNLEI